MKVCYIPKLDARSVFNLTSPRYLPQLSRHWSGKLDWWHMRYEPVRDLCERRYIEEFNKRTGHYALLEECIKRDGFRNPVMLTAGRLVRRHRIELPPAIRLNSHTIVCEYLGGSRLLIAARLGLSLPAIVNDFANVFPLVDPIAEGDTAALLSHFTDLPRSFKWKNDGSVYVNYLPYTHYPPQQRITGRQQCDIRQEVLSAVFAEVREWMEQNDH